MNEIQKNLRIALDHAVTIAVDNTAQSNVRFILADAKAFAAFLNGETEP